MDPPCDDRLADSVRLMHARALVPIPIPADPDLSSLVSRSLSKKGVVPSGSACNCACLVGPEKKTS